MFIAIAGTIPRNIIFAANLRYYPNVPWAVPFTGVYMWLFWRYLQGYGPPSSTAEFRRLSLRAKRIPGRLWWWALLSGGLGIAGLVMALRIANRLVTLPQQRLPDFAQVPRETVVTLLLAAAPVAGIIEEAAFRGYMQGPIERRWGLVVAILISGTLFAVAHLDFTMILWPYYVAVGAIYGAVTYLTKSILPAIVLHTGGNIYSNLQLWLYGKAEWQASPGATLLIWQTGTDASFWISIIVFLIVVAAMVWATLQLERTARRTTA
jgi:membrane protease YdiL (CAAX protease family)